RSLSIFFVWSKWPKTCANTLNCCLTSTFNFGIFVFFCYGVIYVYPTLILYLV
ncbi:hypothetical protein L9F63_017076, partial [Diploptera punctata]